MASPLFIRVQVEKALRQSELAEECDHGPLFDHAAAVVDRKERKEQEKGRQAKPKRKLFLQASKASKQRRVQVALAANRRHAQRQQVLRPQQLCFRFGRQLGLDAACTKVSQELIKRMSLMGGLAGGTPLSGAAACIYMASHLMKQAKTAQEIAGVVGVSQSMIRTSYEFLYRQQHRLVDKECHKDKNCDIAALPST